MIEKNLQNGIDEIKKVVMTSDEKSRMLQNILNFPIQKTTATKSPWSVFSFVSFIQRKQSFTYVLIPVITILVGGGIAVSSERSLPNSVLYPIKVGVLEPLRGVLTFSPKEKALYESNLATKRLVEAEILQGQGKLDVPTENKINILLDSHTTSLNNSLNDINKNDSATAKEDIITNFHAEMNAHAQILDILSGNNKKTEVNNQNIDSEISKTARDNANKIINITESNEKNNLDKYKNKKEAVQSLINKTATDINSATTDGQSSSKKPEIDTNSNILIDNSSQNIPTANSNTENKTNPIKEKDNNINNTQTPSPTKQEIIYSTKQTLDKANQYLKEADTHEKNGDNRDAYSNLLNSESSAKEANIFLKIGLKLEEKNTRENRDN
ncbi:MAG: DUF5667 domain-containing protein [bacterium]